MRLGYPQVALQVPQVLLPNPGVALDSWAVIACDQYTTAPEYWRQVEELVGDVPSTLRAIFPEVHLGDLDRPRRIERTHRQMRRYLETGILQPLPAGFVLVDRETPRTDSRKGLLACLDPGPVRLRTRRRDPDPRHRGDRSGAAAAPYRDPPRRAAGAAPRDGADRRPGQHRDRAAVRKPRRAAPALRLRADDGRGPPAGMARPGAGAHRRGGRRPLRSRLRVRRPLRRQPGSRPAAVRGRGRQPLAGGGPRGLGGGEAQRGPGRSPGAPGPWSSWSTCTTPACASSPSTASSSRPTRTSCCRPFPATAARGGRTSRSPVSPTGSSGEGARRSRPRRPAPAVRRQPPPRHRHHPPAAAAAGGGVAAELPRRAPESGTASTTSTAATGWKSSEACPATSASSPRPSTRRACSAPSSATAPCRGSRSPWARRRRSATTSKAGASGSEAPGSRPAFWVGVAGGGRPAPRLMKTKIKPATLRSRPIHRKEQ